MSTNEKKFQQSFGLLDATMVVAGSMIGSGIFIVSAEITRSLGSAGWLTLMWILTAVITIIAAVSYGELAGMFPKAGGQYVYLREAYGPFVAFLFGWTMFGVIQAGSIAAVGVAFASFTSYIIKPFGSDNVLMRIGDFTISAAQLVAITSVIFLTYINSRGVKNGRIVQTIFTITKLLSLFGIIILGLWLGASADVWNTNWQQAWTPASWQKSGNGISASALTGVALLGAIAISMKGSLFSSDSWNNVTFIAAEIKNPKKNIGRALFFGTLIVSIIYISANLMYLAVLPLNEIAFASNDRVGVAVAEKIFGSSGSIIIAVMLMISTFGCNNGLILSGARVYYTMSNDGLFFKKTGQLNKFSVPANGLWLQCIWACVLCLSGKYNDLLAMVIFGVLIFYVLTICGIFLLRKKQPDTPRPYKAFGYPVLPLIYIVIASSLALLLLYYEKKYTIPGLVIILLGIPVYLLARRREQKSLNKPSIQPD